MSAPDKTYNHDGGHGVITDRDMLDQVIASVGPDGGDFDCVAIRDEILRGYGLCDIDEVPDGTYWQIVERHDIRLPTAEGRA